MAKIKEGMTSLPAGSWQFSGKKPGRRKSVKYGNLTLGQIEAGINKLGGEEGFILLLQDKLEITKKVETVPVGPREWTVWKTIKIGTGLKNANQFQKALKAAGLNIGDWGNDILGQKAFTAATQEQELELVKTTVRELGFTHGATCKKIYDRALESGLDLCPAEVGPQLRLQYKDQPDGEWLLVAMEPIIASDRELRVFYVERDSDDLWLRAYYGHPGNEWGADDRWVFVRRKS